MADTQKASLYAQTYALAMQAMGAENERAENERIKRARKLLQQMRVELGYVEKKGKLVSQRGSAMKQLIGKDVGTWSREAQGWVKNGELTVDAKGVVQPPGTKATPTGKRRGARGTTHRGAPTAAQRNATAAATPATTPENPYTINAIAPPAKRLGRGTVANPGATGGASLPGLGLASRVAEWMEGGTPAAARRSTPSAPATTKSSRAKSSAKPRKKRTKGRN